MDTLVIQLGALGVLLLVLYLLFRALLSGTVRSQREVDYLIQQWEDRLAERDTEISEWRSAYETERAARELAADHARELATGFNAVNRTLDALRERAEGTGRAP